MRWKILTVPSREIPAAKSTVVWALLILHNLQLEDPEYLEELRDNEGADDDGGGVGQGPAALSDMTAGERDRGRARRLALSAMIWNNRC